MTQLSAPAGETNVAEENGTAVDWSVLDALKALQRPGKPDLRAQLMTVYLNSSPPLMDGIRTAVGNGDAQALADAAHALKSSSMSVGAIRFGQRCAELEKLGKTSDMERASHLVSQADALFSAVCDAFRQALEGKE